jgi:hypothetical protein
MANSVVTAGDRDSAFDTDADWIILDIGFAAKEKTCGVMFVAANTWRQECNAPIKSTYAEATNLIGKKLQEEGSALNLVIEAPLSGAFTSSGNPVGRKLEKRGSKTRYWYNQPGTTVSLAALILLRKAVAIVPKRKLRLFEGFVSFGERGNSSDHMADVLSLKKSIWSENLTGKITIPECVHSGDEASVVSLTTIIGIEIQPPAIFVAEKG